MENIDLHLKLVRGVRGVPLDSVDQHHVKVAHFLGENDKYLNFDAKIIARAPIFNETFNSKYNENSLNRVYFL